MKKGVNSLLAYTISAIILLVAFWMACSAGAGWFVGWLGGPSWASGIGGGVFMTTVFTIHRLVTRTPEEKEKMSVPEHLRRILDGK